ncbi:hypothetical protein [Nonomuraea sp. NPDC049158]|uniref:hypothetical protein n=1 Tax=Nonomuraea sp. NPDC049158 TaxID=3155649 RepID=UPI0033E73A63
MSALMTEAVLRGLVLYLLILLTMGVAALYFARATMPRPPVGRFVWTDIWIMVVALVAMPFAYMHMPTGVIVTIFGVVVFTVSQLVLSPVLGGRNAALAAALLCAADVAAYFAQWPTAVLVVNDLTMILLTVGVANMWAQTGMRAAHVAGLAGALTVYDALATGVSSLTADFVSRVEGLPFAPILATGYGPVSSLAGLGDCLMLAVWPLVAAKAYGRTAGWWAAVVEGTLLLGLTLAVLLTDLEFVPLLLPLGPLIVGQHLFWRRRERARALRAGPGRVELAQALEDLPADARSWVALHEGAVVATGSAPGTARRAARQAGVTAVPVVRGTGR